MLKWTELSAISSADRIGSRRYMIGRRPFRIKIGYRIARMTVLRIAAFSDGNQGGNPAGVWIGDALPAASRMQAIARRSGFRKRPSPHPRPAAWRVRYFSPLCEGAVLRSRHHCAGCSACTSARRQDLPAEAQSVPDISVAGRRDGQTIAAALQSPPTRSAPLDPSLQADMLQLFGYTRDDLDFRIPPARIHAGADHAVLALKNAQRACAHAL